MNTTDQHIWVVSRTCDIKNAAWLQFFTDEEAAIREWDRLERHRNSYQLNQPPWYVIKFSVQAIEMK